ncbi:MAG: cell filamentation protein Fic [Bacteroidales bacterium 36-12]|jgi:Fic family protein|nr:MAG: cell filamentation protein Fic [Bacteroidales bacterium 36-12]
MNKTFQSGKYINQGFHRSFLPSKINKNWEISDMQVISLLSQADRHLGKLDMYSEYINIDLYLAMHIAKEATQSSRIEGTQTQVKDAFLSKDNIKSERRDDWEELQNYILAMNVAVSELQNIPFSGRLFRKAHQILLSGVRGEHKLPGEYRKSQNWIGGATLQDAIFIPPAYMDVDELMSDLEIFANDELNPLPILLKTALIHYQFETIHPFLDGNGRVGRLLITLYLVSQGILKRPILYLSDFFEKHRSLYYDNLMRVRTHNDINQWFKFFLTGIIETSKKGTQTFDAILQIQQALDEKLKPLGGRAADARLVFNELFKNPIIQVDGVEKIINKSNVSAYKLINDLEKLGLIKEITGSQRDKLYAFQEYIDLFS